MSDKDRFLGDGTAGLIILILAAHIAGDLFLRVDAWFGIWRTMPGYLIHALIWTISISIVLAVYELFAVQKFLFLFLTHYIIDTNKLYMFNDRFIGGNIIDQALHMISILLVLFLPSIIMLIRKKAQP